jgi:2-polyprenyl-3-methyl-5-hydroxy-6-metoxy-1,4-benzoquinol methylase
MKKYITSCILCGSTGRFEKVISHIRDSYEHSVVLCKSCDHVQISPLPTREEDRIFYNKNKQPKNIGVKVDIASLRTRQIYDTTRRADFVSRYVPIGARILDVGSSYGFFLEQMSKKGYKVTGIEVSAERRNISNKVTRAPVLDINLLEKDIGIGQFDAVVMFHVLEHVPDPVKFCLRLKEYISEKGCLIVEVPNLDDLMLEESMPYKLFWWQRAHLSYFGCRTLKHVFKKAGYPKVTIEGNQRYGIDNMMQWIVTGKPQLKRPLFQTEGSHKWLEEYYKHYLVRKKRCDTLVAIAHKGK